MSEDTNCQEILKLASTHLDGELGDETSIAMVEMHLRVCPDCAAAKRHLYKIRLLMADLERKSPPPVF